MPKISVIVPVYNVEKYLSRSLDCLVNQTLKDIEIILINDCSPDNSLEIMQDYASKDERIKIIDLKENSGAAIARNKGLEIAAGEYLGFIDPDDAIDLNYYEELYKAAKDGDYDIVKCQRKTIFEDKKFEISTLNKTIEEKGKYNFTYEWTTAIYRHSIIKENNIKFPEECRKAQDVVFLTKIIFKAKSLKLIDHVFYYYHKRNDSLNAKKIPLKNIESANLARRLILQEVNNSSLYDTNPELYIKVYSAQFSSVFFTLSQNDTFQAKKLCAQCIIDNTYFCKDVEKFITNFSYPWMIEYIKNKDCNTLAKYLKRIKNNSYIQKPLLWYQKIFSCRNDVRRKYKKILYILGIKFSIKKNKLEIKTQELEDKIFQLETSLEKQNNILNKTFVKSLNELNSKIDDFYVWRTDFHKEIPSKFPISLSENERTELIKQFNNHSDYLEFGAGGSTFLALLNSNINITSIESDENWLNFLRSWAVILKYEHLKRLVFKHVDIGKTGKWGYPVSEAKKEFYPNYSSKIFEEKKDFDLIFIDGRFRVACALAAILNCKNSTTILIHDYPKREEYHIVEKYLERIDTIDTLAIFKIKSDISFEDVRADYLKYKCVTK